MENPRLFDWECVAASLLSVQMNPHCPKWTHSPNAAFNNKSRLGSLVTSRLGIVQSTARILSGRTELNGQNWNRLLCACPLTNCCGAKQRSTSLILALVLPIGTGDGSLTMGISLAATGLLGGVVQPSSPVGGREGTDNDQVQLQKQEKISQEEAKELKQV